MLGIDLDGAIDIKTASLRFFEPNERHVNRFCSCDVLVLVYDGVLRFCEDGEAACDDAVHPYRTRNSSHRTWKDRYPRSWYR